MFDGFVTEQVDVGEASLLVRHGGDGPPVLLLHGHPRTSATWHRVAPLLVAAGFRVICPDLRGYGRSRGPDPTPDHRAHSKRAAAGDLARLMTHLGHDTFAVAGHDRGSYVALRLTLDKPQRVTRLAMLDGIPISEHLSRMGPEFATRWWHWFFFAQPDIPERVIGADPDAWYRGEPELMGVENHAEFRAATRDPRVVRAMLEDYRAGLTVDRADEEADRAAGVRVQPPVLVLWSLGDDLADLYGDPLEVWRGWPTTSADTASTRATTWPRRRRSHSPPRSPGSSGRKPSRPDQAVRRGRPCRRDADSGLRAPELGAGAAAGPFRRPASLPEFEDAVAPREPGGPRSGTAVTATVVVTDEER